MKFNSNCRSSDFCSIFSKLLFYPRTGNVVFSLKTNSYKQDEFARRVMNMIKISKLNILLSFVLPDFLMRFFRISNLRKEGVDYFSKLTLTLIDERKKNKGGFLIVHTFSRK